jgi:MFS family permease
MTLIITLTLMGASTFLIGLLPTYEHIGILAPVALITLRFIQGVASGGEWGGGVLMLNENAPAQQKGYYTAWSQVGVSGGFVLSSLAFYLVQLLPQEDVLAWAWRIPFLLSLFIFLVGVYIRRNIEENAEFVARKHASGERCSCRCSAPLNITRKRSCRPLVCGWRKTARSTSFSPFP